MNEGGVTHYAEMGGVTIFSFDGDVEDRKDDNGDWVAHVTGRTGGEHGAAKTAFARENFETFTEKNIFWPISQSIIDVNPAIKQTAGY